MWSPGGRTSCSPRLRRLHRHRCSPSSIARSRSLAAAKANRTTRVERRAALIRRGGLGNMAGCGRHGDRYAAVRLCLLCAMACSVPAATIVPPSSPAPGPTSITQSLSRMTLTKRSARQVALSLKRSAERSDRRSSTPFRSAMSMLNSRSTGAAGICRLGAAAF